MKCSTIGAARRSIGVLALLALGSCGHDTAEGATGAKSDAVPAPPAQADAGAAAPRGMIWISPGTLRAGTPKNVVPRIAEEEMPGVDVSLGGYWIDALPYPNEPGAIATSNVSRDEAEQLCASQSKRLCTELEWEHACKGAANATYEYGDVYSAEKCGTGGHHRRGLAAPGG